MSELCDRCKGHPRGSQNQGDQMKNSITQAVLEILGTERKTIADALRKRAELLSPYDNDRLELLRAADLIESGELP